MDAAQWQLVSEVFRGALERDPKARAGYLRRTCAGDHALRAEVASLLEAHRDAGGFLEDPRDQAVSRRTPAPAVPTAGRRVGAYEIRRRIGCGGMGTVYAAVRADGVFDKQVAVKLLRRHPDSAEFVRRFETERQILARLEHPHIARLLDGGTTADALPYFVMELVEGQPIDEYCNARRLSISQRLELFRKVCTAVQFAHRNLVVHRDLKPSNILVTHRGEPKLLDFGIAKILDPSATVPAATATAMRLLTPDYASPEQISGEGVTTASDVYSLGVLLYHLLTARLPFKPGSSPIETLWTVRNEPPTPPSLAAAPDLRRRLAGDLDTIVLKALRKEPERRYGTVEQLSEDLGRHQRGRPVLARGDTLGYRCGKLLRRHPFRFAVAVAALVALLGFALLMTHQRLEITAERDLLAAQRQATEAERRRAEQVTAFLVDLFQASDPQGRDAGGSLTARELLERGAERLERGLADQPVVGAEMKHTIGVIYAQLGLFGEAAPLLGSALAIRRELLGPDSAEAAETLRALALNLKSQGDYDRAEPLYREALAVDLRLFGIGHARVAEDRVEYAHLLLARGDREQAEQLYRQALPTLREALGAGHVEVAYCLHSLAMVVAARGETETAEGLYREALALLQHLYGPDHPNLVATLGGLANVLRVSEDFDEAEQLYRQALAIRRQALGERSPYVAISLNALARLLTETGDFESAEPLVREALDISWQTFPGGHWRINSMEIVLADCLIASGGYAEAESLLLRGYEILRTKKGARSGHTRRALASLVRLYRLWDKPAEAAKLEGEKAA